MRAVRGEQRLARGIYSLTPDTDGNGKQREGQRSRIDDIEEKVYNHILSHGLAPIAAPVLHIHPLLHTNFLQSSARFHLCRGSPHFSRLISNSQACEGGNDNYPPVGPIEGCVPTLAGWIGLSVPLLRMILHYCL